MHTVIARKPKKRRRDGAGFSIPGAAEEIGVSYKTLRDAIELNQVRTIKFGRITRVPQSEVARLKEVFAAANLEPMRETTMTVGDVLGKIAEQLAWRGPTGRHMAHVVLERAEAEYLHEAVIAIIIERDQLAHDLESKK